MEKARVCAAETIQSRASFWQRSENLISTMELHFRTSPPKLEGLQLPRELGFAMV